MIYAPRALRHFSLAAMESRAYPAAPPPASRPAPSRVVPLEPARRTAPPSRRPRSRTVVRLWFPATLLFLLLAPFALLLAPLIYFAPRPYNLRPLATVLGVGHLLLSLGGTVVEVDAPDALVHIRIF